MSLMLQNLMQANENAANVIYVLIICLTVMVVGPIALKMFMTYSRYENERVTRQMSNDRLQLEINRLESDLAHARKDCDRLLAICEKNSFNEKK